MGFSQKPSQFPSTRNENGIPFYQERTVFLRDLFEPLAGRFPGSGFLDLGGIGRIERVASILNEISSILRLGIKNTIIVI